MRRTSIELDERLFEQASRILGTRGLKVTVQRAFEEVLAVDARRRAIRQLADVDGLDLDRPHIIDDAWR